MGITIVDQNVFDKSKKLML